MKIGFRVLLLAGLAAVADGPVLADPLTDLLDRGNGGACYDRVYDEAHLAKNPKQATRSIRVSLRDYPKVGGANIRIEIVGETVTSYVVGECNWDAEANLDVQGKKLVEAFKGPSGLNCHAGTSSDGSSAEEGGDFPVDLRDGRTIVVYLPDSMAAWHSYDRSQGAEWTEFGPDDRIFRLDRTGTGQCRDMDENLPWWE
jgi:hypothetical protein